MADRVALAVEVDGRLWVAPSGEGFHLLEVPELPTALAGDDPASAARGLLETAGIAGSVRPVQTLDLRGDVLGHRVHVFSADVGRVGESTLDAGFEPRASLLDRFGRGGKVGPALASVLASDATSDSAHRVAPFVELIALRTHTLPPATHTNAFLVGGSRAVVIEPATDDAVELARLARHVDERRARGTVFESILLTHHHPDHAGGAEALRALLGLPLVAHRMTAERLAGKVHIDQLLDEGDTVDLGETALDVMHTPGHAPGHLVFVERTSGAMIAGDMIAGVGTILVEPYDGDMQLYLESLERMRRRGASMLLPAHGGVVGDPDAWLRHYVAHRLAREAKIVEALRSLVRGTIADVVPVAYADTPPFAWPLARMSTAGHLVKLVREGRVVADGETYALA